MRVKQEYFGTLQSGETVNRYVLTNANGMSVQVLDYGCIIQSIVVPDQNGNAVDVVLGYDTLADYEQGTCFHGAFVGRYANRIGDSRFTLNGTEYTLQANEGNNHLHGVYETSVFEAEVGQNAVIFRRTSPDGEEGYPGTVELTVTYRLTEDNELLLEYEAVSDADTVINLTNHSYFNLNGHDSGSTEAHLLKLNASRFTVVRPDSIPTGELRDVAGTPFDFRREKPIGRDRDLSDEQLKLTQGFDHNFVLDTNGAETPAAIAWGDQTGICMECRTTQPGIQFYNANFLQTDACFGRGKNGASYGQYSAFCLETQHFPDTPNQPEFPTAVLRAGEMYHQMTGYRFKISKMIE